MAAASSAKSVPFGSRMHAPSSRWKKYFILRVCTRIGSQSEPKRSQRQDGTSQAHAAFTCAMPTSPTCANCGRPMVETPRSMRAEGEWDVSVFECSTCHLDFFTEDHVPLAGSPAPGIGTRLMGAIRRAVHHTITPTRH